MPEYQRLGMGMVLMHGLVPKAWNGASKRSSFPGSRIESLSYSGLAEDSRNSRRLIAFMIWMKTKGRGERGEGRGKREARISPLPLGEGPGVRASVAASASITSPKALTLALAQRERGPLSSAPLEVREVRNRGDFDRFIKVPWQIYAEDPHWVPPLLIEVKEFLNRRKHPFYKHGEATQFIAVLRGGETVGRVLVSDDPRYNQDPEPRRCPLRRGGPSDGALPHHPLRGVRGRGCPSHPHRRRLAHHLRLGGAARHQHQPAHHHRLPHLRTSRSHVPPRPQRGRRPLPGACRRPPRRPHPTHAPVLRPCPRHLGSPSPTTWSSGEGTLRWRFPVRACGTSCAPAPAPRRSVLPTAGWRSTTGSIGARPGTRWGALLLDGNDPGHVIARSPEPDPRAHRPYERTGVFNDAVFACGLVPLDPQGARIRVYYGAADRCLAAADFAVQDILDQMTAVLRHLARLGRSVPFAGERALAVAVYADGLNEPVRAGESGYEGVACVDDAARALDLYCALWKATRLPWVRGAGAMGCSTSSSPCRARTGAGWNFDPRLGGHTQPGGAHLRGRRPLLAGPGRARPRPCRPDSRRPRASSPHCAAGFPHILAATEVASDVRALHIGAALALADQPDDQGLGERLPVWSEELLSCREAGHADELAGRAWGAPHLWGHIQEGVLAEAAVRLGRDDWLAVASRSAELVFASAVRGGFDLARVQPYDVASAVYTLDAAWRRPPETPPSPPWSPSRAPGSTGGTRRASRSTTAARGARGRRHRPAGGGSARAPGPRPTSSAPRPSSMTPLPGGPPAQGFGRPASRPRIARRHLSRCAMTRSVRGCANRRRLVLKGTRAPAQLAPGCKKRTRRRTSHPPAAGGRGASDSSAGAVTAAA